VDRISRNYPGLRPLLLEQDRGIETGRPTADDRDLHGKPPDRSDMRIILSLKDLPGKGQLPDAATVRGDR
jgi:hypothetical protein